MRRGGDGRRSKIPRIGGQPHYHPQPGGLDGRGNCPACADYSLERYPPTGRELPARRISC